MKKIIIIIVIIIGLLIISYFNYLNSNSIKKVENKTEVKNKVKLIINNNEYTLQLEDNQTAKEFINILPIEIIMEELNGNEKYYYLDKKLPVSSYNSQKINKGDVMLYGNNCLVIFYESFDTNYNYSKIGHIENLPNLGKDNIKVSIIK